MKYASKFQEMGFPDFLKFGIELEAFNVKTRGTNSLNSGQSATFIRFKDWHMATPSEESLVSEGGAELTSPILKDSQENGFTI